MKKKILLVDDSLTVQKVVALTLDRNRFTVLYAKSKQESTKQCLEQHPDLILVSDQVHDVTASSFPKEVESWLGKNHTAPPVILITGQDLKEVKNYRGVLRKPFSPQTLQNLVQETLAASVTTPTAPAPSPQDVKTRIALPDDADEGRLHRVFNDTFPDEARLVRETFENDLYKSDEDEATLISIPAPTESVRPAAPPRSASPKPIESVAELWGGRAPLEKPTETLMDADNSMAFKATLENRVEEHVHRADFEATVQKVLDRVLPSIVERLVQERIDALMKEQEDFVELKA